METSTENLEHILRARDFGPQYYPDLFRMLRELELVFLLPSRPEMVCGPVAVKEGDRLPPFAVWGTPKDGRRIPIFSSPKLASDACKAVGAQPNEFALATMPGEGLFQLLACQKNPIVINPACRTNSVFLDQSAVRQLGDGSILRGGTDERRDGTVERLDPADFPTDLVQALFTFLKQRPAVRAAWILREMKAAGTRPGYVFVLSVEGDATVLEREFRVVASATCPKDSDYGVAVLQPAHAELIQFTARITPFYARPDYAPHRTPKRARRKKG